jgi:hypothetical protein
MELLIIKSGENYIRFKNGDYLCCKLDKASVFSPEQLEEVKTHVTALKAHSFPQVCIRKLRLTEGPFEA